MRSPQCGSNTILFCVKGQPLNYACEEEMMSERKPCENPNQRASIGFVLMLLLSTLGVLATVPASSVVDRSIGIIEATHRPDAGILFDTISFEAEVTNFFQPVRSPNAFLVACDETLLCRCASLSTNKRASSTSATSKAKPPSPCRHLTFGYWRKCRRRVHHRLCLQPKRPTRIRR